MPEIFRAFKTGHWTLSVWSKDIATPRRQLQRTLQVRNPESAGRCLTELKLSTSLSDTELFILPADCFENCLDENDELLDSCRLQEIEKTPPVFFENRDYQFTFSFEKTVKNPRIIHPLAAITDSFHFRKKREFSGTINFGNSIGWFHLKLQYLSEEHLFQDTISFQVLPTKMDLHSDLESILQIVDKTYPLWRFSFAQKTDEELARSRKPHERFLLLWLAQFDSLCKSLVEAVRFIISQPHTRLLPDEQFIRPEKIKKKLTGRLEERIERNLRDGIWHLKYRIEKKTLQVDTPENRFVKMVLDKTVKNLNKLITVSASDNRLSTVFKNTIKERIMPFQTFLNTPLFSQVGVYKGVDRESLVLHHRAGYAKVYRIWQELKMYLDLFGRSANISLKTVSELYEVWCFLEIRRILIDIGFTEKENRKPRLVKQGLELGLVEGENAAFVLHRKGITIDLSHEPVFGTKKEPAYEALFSFTEKQKPDILLKATFPDGKKLYWIFDAKYRIDGDEKYGVDYVPEDAINQMHRYRDALIHLNKDEMKKRPVLGAYALYPGFFDEEMQENPYKEGIEEVGIGAFPLLPGRKNRWFEKFITGIFGGPEHYGAVSSNLLLLEEAPRIVTSYLTAQLHDDLTMVTWLGGQREREQSYFDKFKNGVADWYHVRVDSFERKYHKTAIDEICFIAPFVQTGKENTIPYIYEVLSVRKLMRSEITIEQSGAPCREDRKNWLYWLFELGNPIVMKNKVIALNRPRFNFKFIKKSDLFNTKSWDEIKDTYNGVQRE